MFSEKPIKATQTQTFLQKLKELNLEPIAHQLMQSGWTYQQTMCAINRYKIFLFLIYLYPHTPLVPTQEIDQVWHCHILHTRKYREDCQMLFGYFIDHEPNLKIRQTADGIRQKGEEFSFLCCVLPDMVSNLKIGNWELGIGNTRCAASGYAYRELRNNDFHSFIVREPRMASDLNLWEIAEQQYLDTAFAQTQALLIEYFGEAALGDTTQEQRDSMELAENLPQQQKLCKKISWHLQRSACGRPESSLREIFQFSVSQC